MTEPVIEHKHRQDTAFSLLEARLCKSERAARDMLRDLEEVMVRCGYTRDGIYNSRHAARMARGKKGTVILWKGGKILLGSGVKTTCEPIGVGRFNASELVRVATHLVPFVDALENNVRHQIKALEDAMKTIQGIIDRVEESPMPSETPAQMEIE